MVPWCVCHSQPYMPDDALHERCSCRHALICMLLHAMQLHSCMRCTMHDMREVGDAKHALA
eukprot:364863-Chlamydomonas_euryale.AAC.2